MFSNKINILFFIVIFCNYVYSQEVNEVKEGSECGISLVNYEDIKEDDIIECFNVKTELPKL